MKILSRKNGVALVAVLTVLLVLTLLLPVMFRTSENATYTSVNELNRQKAGYLARTGAEMAVATLRSTLRDTAYKDFYAALKNDQKVENSTYGITKNDSGHLQVSMEPISLYLKDGANGAAPESLYLSGTETPEDPSFEFAGKTEITITFNGDPEYYNAETHKKVTKDEACDPVEIDGKTFNDKETGEPIQEINEGYLAVFNDNFMVKSTAVVNGQKATRSAAVIETRNMYDTSNPKESFIAYTQQYWSLAPDFVKIIEGDYPTPVDGYTNSNNKPEKNYSYGGNHVLPNPFMATSKKEIKSFGASMNGETLVESYNDKHVYIYSTIGNMHLNLPEGMNEYVSVIDHDGDRGGNTSNYLALGAYPGLNWRVFENTEKDDLRTSLNGINYDESKDSVQKYNFTSFCATDTLKVSLPIELRVNPKRSSRTGDNTFGGLTDLIKEVDNATLFKVMNFQAKDVVFEKRIDLFASICTREFDGMSVRDCEVKAYRGGFLNLSTPANTPYSYYNTGRNETVSAGIVYFTEPVYLWFQDYEALGTDTNKVTLDPHANSGGETMFLTGVINDNTGWKSFDGSSLQVADGLTDDLIVFKMFDKGDVYYFNAEATKENTQVPRAGEQSGENIGINLVNWFLETKYFPVASKSNNSVWSYLLDFRKTLYIDYIANTLANDKTYVEDDMHFIGNMNEDPTLVPPEIENDLYVIWDN